MGVWIFFNLIKMQNVVTRYPDEALKRISESAKCQTVDNMCEILNVID